MQQKLLVGTSEGLHELGDDRRTLVAGHEVGALAREGSGWWAIIDQGQVWRSDADGKWSQVASVEAERANCLLPTVAGLFVGTSEAHLYSVRDSSPMSVHAFEETQGRDEWYTPWGGPPDVRSMTADPSGAIYVNVHVGGVVRSTDEGKSWEPTLDIHSDVHQVLFDAGSGLLFAASARGLDWSADGGRSWSFDSDGLHADYLRAVAVASRTVLVSASTGPYTDRAAIYQRPLDGSAPFERCEHGLPDWFSDNIDTFCLATYGSSAAFGTRDGVVFGSPDQGRSWTMLAEGLPPVRCVTFA